jgi:AcrR family transcriptional regulator
VTDTARGVGRPRHVPPQRSGASGRDQILDAAAQLFSEQGYTATSTRQIADAVGVKQASLYYHFESKQDILAQLLAGTVAPSLTFARRLARTDERPHIQLYALARYDVGLLTDERWNIGALYNLPEVREHEQFQQFRRDRKQLQRAYRRRVMDGVDEGVFHSELPELGSSLVFALAESVIAMRADGMKLETLLPHAIATACLRLLSCHESDVRTAVEQWSTLQPFAS